MDWLTREEIQKAAETSLLAAVRCSKKHWWQIATATKDELRTAWRARHFAINTEYCALCYIYSGRKKRSCPLKRRERLCGACCEEYENASGIFCDWLRRDASHSDFTKAARKLHKRLCQEEKKLIKASKK